MISTAPPPQIDNIPSVVDENNELVMRGRIKDPAALASTYQTLHTADWASSRARALYQSMIDGAPPYSEARDRASGLAGRVNVNWGLAAQAQDEAEMPYTDILEGLDSFGDVPTNYGDEKEQQRCEAIISEEVTRLIRGWEDFDSRWQQNAHLFVAEGLSFAFFEDEQDWRWRVYGQQFLKFPRRIEANVNKLDIVTCKVDMLPHELWRKVENPEVAKASGWNREAVIQAIKDTCGQHGLTSNDPQERERAWKDNDLNLGTTASNVPTIYGWVREVDGSVSQYIARYDGAGDWLYKCEDKAHAMSNMLFDYKYGVGANGDFQSIRGLGQKLFSSATGLNRLYCKLLDMAFFQATPKLQCENEDAGNENAFRPLGPYEIIQAGYTFPENKMPDFNSGLIAGAEQLQQIFRSRATPYAPTSANGMDRTQRTKFEWQIRSEEQGKLSSAGMNLFFAAWKKHFKEIVRRISRRDYTAAQPGGQEVWEFRRRCLARGVPLEAIYQIDVERIEVNKGIGKGSVTERRSVLGILNEQIYYRLDQEGQHQLNYATVLAYTDARIARQLVPEQAGLRPPVDLQIALLENSVLIQGAAVPVTPNQDHIVHLETHLGKLGEINQQLIDMAIEMDPAINQMFPLWQHAGEHLALCDPMNPKVPELKEAMEQLGEVIINGKKHIDAEAQRAAEEGQDPNNPQANGQAPNPNQVEQAVQAQGKIQQAGLDLAKKRQEIVMAAERHKQELAFKDAKFAADLRNQQAQKNKPNQ